VDELSNWYIRRNRRRFWKSESDTDKAAAYRTLYDTLVSLASLMTPFIPFLTETMYQNLVRQVNADAPVSVHLTNFPEVDSSLIDERLSSDMAAVLEVVRLGRAARGEANVKVRQPLPAVLIHSREPGLVAAVDRLQDQLLDELNVKEARPLVELGDVVSYDIRPKLPVLGPKYGKRLGAIRAALAEVPAARVAELVRNGATVELMLPDGEQIELHSDEILVDLVKRAGYAAAQGPRATVVLDTALSPELINEGLARDFVRGVQDTRKSAGYRIQDRIEIEFSADPEVMAALEQHAEYVSAETLAESVTAREVVGASDQLEPEAVEGPLGAKDSSGRYLDQIEVGGHHVRIALRRA
jgi:isoleucyl-tRNA synthetase